MNEQQRQLLEKKLELTKETQTRKQLGQFSTPYEIALSIVNHVFMNVDTDEIKFIEPAVGSGVFLSALSTSDVVKNFTFSSILGVDIDEEYINIAKNWGNIIDCEDISFLNSDFLNLEATSKFNLLISNPPYVRHHRLSSELKEKYKLQIKKLLDIKVSGLSDLYVYFILLSHNWINKNGIVSWLVPAEFLDVNYGQALKKYLLTNVSLLNIHIYNQNNSLFESANVTSAVITYKMSQPTGAEPITFSFGDDINNPESTLSYTATELEKVKKWSQKEKKWTTNHKFKISDFFDVKRGIATGDNHFFILSEEVIKKFNIEKEVLTPILPSPRNLKTDIISSSSDGLPIIENPKYLLNISLYPEETEKKYPNAWNYLKTGLGTTSERYITKNRRVWYWQEQREAAPIVLSYMSRNKNSDKLSFRFIRNYSSAIAPNSYLLLYPKNNIFTESFSLDDIYDSLTKIEQSQFDKEGRRYGGGLKKIEPRELPNVEFSIE